MFELLNNSLMMNRILFLLILSLYFSCTPSNDRKEQPISKDEPEIIIRKRADGTASSVNQVEGDGVVHGYRITYYGDGKTIHSKLHFVHGIKNGPSIKYYKNGEICENANYTDGKKHGVTRKFYKDGTLSSICEYDKGIAKPGLKEYSTDGTLITSYPQVIFREKNFLELKNRIDLEISCTKKSQGVKFYLLQHDGGDTSRIYLITENGTASRHYYITPGNHLHKKIEIIAEIPTGMKNLLVKHLKYELSAEN